MPEQLRDISRIVPSIVLVSEAAILRTLVTLVIVVIVVVIARLPPARLFRNRRVKLPSLVFVLAFFCGERIVEIVYAFRVMW